MALATRQNSGLTIKIDRKGRMHFYVHGHRVPTFSVTTESEASSHGRTLVSVPTQAIAFEQVESDPIKDDPLAEDPPDGE